MKPELKFFDVDNIFEELSDSLAVSEGLLWSGYFSEINPVSFAKKHKFDVKKNLEASVAPILYTAFTSSDSPVHIVHPTKKGNIYTCSGEFSFGSEEIHHEMLYLSFHRGMRFSADSEDVVFPKFDITVSAGKYQHRIWYKRSDTKGRIFVRDCDYSHVIPNEVFFEEK